jgi:5'-nucleotidase
VLQVLLTNDDGIEAEGLQTLRRSLCELADVRVVVVAPDGNRSAMARSITTRRPLWVAEVEFGDGSVGYSTDGTPVDCVRLANLGLIGDFTPDLVVSGINHGANLGDDITYSGTVAAAFEAVVLGIPGIAVSQQAAGAQLDYVDRGSFDFTLAARIVARLVDSLDTVPLSPNTLLNINLPGSVPVGIEVTALGKRVYRDELRLEQEEEGRRRYWIYGAAPGYEGTDLAAVAAGRVALTPIHFDLTDRPGIEALAQLDLARLLAP